MGCAVQIHERSEKLGSWAMNSVDGWYLRTSDEHYRCHEIYVIQTRGVRLSDTVHFKHKHITIPTVTPEDTIVKCMNDLTQALKERRNTQGAVEYEALQKLDDLLNRIPTTTTREETARQVTFDPSSKPPAEQQPNPAPMVMNTTPAPRVQIAIPTPRVQNTSKTIAKATIDKPIPAKARQEPTATQVKLRNKIKEARDIRSRLALRTHMELRPQVQRERIQLIRDDETGEYLNYRQLMRHPKHKKIWNTSSANEFGSFSRKNRASPTHDAMIFYLFSVTARY